MRATEKSKAQNNIQEEVLKKTFDSLPRGISKYSCHSFLQHAVFVLLYFEVRTSNSFLNSSYILPVRWKMKSSRLRLFSP